MDHGQQIGTIGNGGDEWGNEWPSAHLHLEIRTTFSDYGLCIGELPGSGYAEDQCAGTGPSTIDIHYRNPTDFIEGLRDGGGQCSAVTGEESMALACEPDVPTVTTSPTVTNRTSTSATVTLNVNPNGTSTTAWFDYDDDVSFCCTTDPPLNAGSGTSNVTLSETLTGLTCDTTYFFRARAQNNEGSASPGSIESFSTLDCASPPGTQNVIENGGFEDEEDHWTKGPAYNFHASTNSAIAPKPRTGSGYAFLATSQGDPANSISGSLSQEFSLPNHATDAELSFWYCISTTEPSSTTEDFLNVTLIDSSGDFLESVRVFSNLNQTGSCSTPSHYQPWTHDVGHHAGDTIGVKFFGLNDESFPSVFRVDDVELWVPDGDDPSVTTDEADQITASSARLSMTVDPGGLDTEVWFAVEEGTLSPDEETEHWSVGSGTSPLTTSLTVTNLDCDTKYYYEAFAENDAGDDDGRVESFETDVCPGGPPDADTNTSSNVTQTSARLNGDVNPNGAATQGWFEWWVDGGTPTATPQQGVGSGSSEVDIHYDLGGLTCETQYSYRAYAENSFDVDAGALRSLTTLACDPPPNTPPQISLIEPDGTGDTADVDFLITWTDSDPDDDAQITLSHSQTSDCASPTEIASGISEDDGVDEWQWGTSGVSDGSYYVLAAISDGINPAQSDCAGPVVVEHVLPQEPVLSVRLEGHGFGTVSSTTHPMDCPGTCRLGGLSDTETVTLAAHPDYDSSLVGWLGVTGCGTSLECAVALTASRVVRPQFEPSLFPPDLSLATASNPALAILANDGNGGLQPLATHEPGTFGSAHLAADLDGDEDLDIAIASPTAGVTILLNDGLGSFNVGMLNLGGTPGTASVSGGDVDRDGDFDLILCTGSGPSDRRFAVWRNDELGSFQEAGVVLGDECGDPNLLVDIDTDGYLDFVRRTTSGSDMEVWRNNGSSGFEPPAALGTGPASAAAILDANNDGASDLVLCGGQLRVLLNDGAGDLTQVADADFPDESGACAAAELTGDTVTDIVVGTSTDFMLLTGNGDGTFGSGPTFAGADRTEIDIGDLDRDGDFDVVLSDFLSGTSEVWTNDGTGSFSFGAEFAGGGAPVVASYRRPVDLGILINGFGDISINGVDACHNESHSTASCGVLVQPQSTASVEAVPAEDWRFYGWNELCAGTSNSSCEEVIDSDNPTVFGAFEPEDGVCVFEDQVAFAHHLLSPGVEVLLRACEVVTVGPNVEVDGADLTIWAPKTVLRNGFSLRDGATLSVATEQGPYYPDG